MGPLSLGWSGYTAPVSCASPMFSSLRGGRLCLSRATPVRQLASFANDGAEIASSISLVVFHRHGDRSPLRGHTPDEELSTPTIQNASAGDAVSRAAAAAAGETSGGGASGVSAAEAFWKGQLVPVEDIKRLDSLYPVRCFPEEDAPPDAISAPFGCLTSLGLLQLQRRGAQLRERYLHRGIDNARLQVFSTNYRRTQLSAQGFLEGFCGGKGGVPVVVRRRAEDFLNQWESQGHDMYELMTTVEDEASFREREETVGGPLKSRLHTLNPALFPLPVGGRFRWMVAADYFMSARARELQVPPELDALGTATIRHLTWRFSRFYGNTDMLKMMTGPLLFHVIECAVESDGGGGGGARETTHRRPAPMDGGGEGQILRVVSSSCHDVTLLALLYALRSDLVDDEDYWPPYGSTIEFAVSKKQEAARGEGVIDADDGLAMKISVDGEPLRSSLFSEGIGGVLVSDFRKAVQDLLWTKN